MTRTMTNLGKLRITLAIAIHCLLLGTALPAFAADAGELCGNFGRTWNESCSDGLSCDIRWSFGTLQLGVCTSSGPTPDVCGGLQGSACPEGQFCQFTIAQSCGAADQTGVCAAPPQNCTEQYAPVCGCDGKTYGNECTAHAASISAASSGECSECNYDDPARTWKARSAEECQRVRFTCDQGQQAFFDDCGCGCEAERADEDAGVSDDLDGGV